MSKYIDLTDRIIERLDAPCGNIRLGIHEALAYLDHYPDEVPGRTITESEFRGAVNSPRPFRSIVEGFGITIDPDPDPDPEEVHKLAQALYDAAFDKPWDSFDDLARQALKRGVKAPGGDDE